jgi:hypothetical protein
MRIVDAYPWYFARFSKILTSSSRPALRVALCRIQRAGRGYHGPLRGGTWARPHPASCGRNWEKLRSRVPCGGLCVGLESSRGPG